MKRVSALVALTFAVAMSAHAQQSTPTSPAAAPATAPAASSHHMHALDPDQQMQHLTKQLQLTPDQQAKIAPMLQQRDQQLQALHNDTTLKPADRRAKAMAIAQQSESQIGAVLTDQQRDKWKAMREKAMERAQDRRGQKMPASSGSSGG